MTNLRTDELRDRALDGDAAAFAELERRHSIAPVGTPQRQRMAQILGEIIATRTPGFSVDGALQAVREHIYRSIYYAHRQPGFTMGDAFAAALCIACDRIYKRGAIRRLYTGLRKALLINGD